MKPVRNVVASVHQKLLNVAKQTSRPFNEIAQYYAIERWLYRLAKSDSRERFVLKGALMLLVWKTSVTRPTRDIDLLARTSNDLESIRGLIADICELSVENDGMTFDPGSITTERIAEDADYEGVRARFMALLGNTRMHMQIDIGFSDVKARRRTRTYPLINSCMPETTKLRPIPSTRNPSTLLNASIPLQPIFFTIGSPSNRQI